MGLYYNGRRNEANASRAPRTAELLGRGVLRRDATSCPFGSAYFSLLRPGTKLAPHCGPTNARLRAHLGLVVPKAPTETRTPRDDGAVGGGPSLGMRVGDETRQWREGELLLFDDSFEHEVWNTSEEARLVLIVDLWHPALRSDGERRAVMRRALERDIYDGVIEKGEYGNTNERGH